MEKVPAKLLLLILIVAGSFQVFPQSTGKPSADPQIVQASGPDSGQIIYYRITSGNYKNYFTVDKKGMLKVNAEIYKSFILKRTFELNVSVTDNDQLHPLSCNTFVKITLRKSTLGKILDPKIRYCTIQYK